MNQLKQRLFYHFFFIIIFSFSLLYSLEPWFQPFFCIVSLGFICTALWEYYQLVKAKKLSPLTTLGMVTSAFYIVALCLENVYNKDPFLAEAVLLVMGFVMLTVVLFRNHQPITSVATTFFGILYIVIPLGCIYPILYADFTDGRFWVIYLLSVSKSVDLAGYFAGKLLGSKPLAKKISPKKTIEGAIAGAICAISLSLLFSYFYPEKLSFLAAFILGVLILFAAIIGDLFESLLKRDAKIKDSNKIPGIGGVLDVVDSLLFIFPLIYLYLYFQKGLL